MRSRDRPPCPLEFHLAIPGLSLLQVLRSPIPEVSDSLPSLVRAIVPIRSHGDLAFLLDSVLECIEVRIEPPVSDFVLVVFLNRFRDLQPILSLKAGEDAQEVTVESA